MSDLNKQVIQDKYDLDYTLESYEKNLGPIADEYFRASLEGVENIPLDQIGKRPIIFIANHSAMGMSWDNIIFDVLIYRVLKEHYGDARKALINKLRRLIDPLLIGDKRDSNLFYIKDWWEKLGSKPATMEEFEALAKENKMIFISPEGTNASSKSFSRRYKLQKFSSSFIYMAMKYNALVVPVTIINAEFTRPLNYRFDAIHNFVRKRGMPMLPIGPAIIQMLFPATYLTPYPVKLKYEIKKVKEFKGNVECYSKEDFKDLAENFRSEFQEVVNESLERNHEPYDILGFLKSFRKSNKKKVMIPFFWHEIFLASAGYKPWLNLLYKIPFGLPLVKFAHKRIDAKTEKN